MKKTLTEAEHIRSMLQEMEMERPDSWYIEPDPEDDYEPEELVDFHHKVYDYEKKFENLLQQAEQNPKQALKVFNDTRSGVENLYDEADELLPPPTAWNRQRDLHTELIRYIQDQVGEEEVGIDEPNPRTKSELKKLIQNRITMMKAINDFIDEHDEYGDISDYVRDKYRDDGSDAGIDVPEREPPKYYDGGYY